MRFLMGVKGWTAVVVIAILVAIAQFLGGFKPIKLIAWAGVAVVAVMAAFNEFKGGN